MTIGQESVMNSNESWRFDILSELVQPNPRRDLKKSQQKAFPQKTRPRPFDYLEMGMKRRKCIKSKELVMEEVARSFTACHFFCAKNP